MVFPNSLDRKKSSESRREQPTSSREKVIKVLSNREKSGTVDILGTKRETPVKCLKGIMAGSSKKVTRSVTQLRCLYTNAHSMSGKQEQVEALSS